LWDKLIFNCDNYTGIQYGTIRSKNTPTMMTNRQQLLRSDCWNNFSQGFHVFKTQLKKHNLNTTPLKNPLEIIIASAANRSSYAALTVKDDCQVTRDTIHASFE
jgi:hypothetical protein